MKTNQEEGGEKKQMRKAVVTRQLKRAAGTPYKLPPGGLQVRIAFWVAFTRKSTTTTIDAQVWMLNAAAVHATDDDWVKWYDLILASLRSVVYYYL